MWAALGDTSVMDDTLEVFDTLLAALANSTKFGGRAQCSLLSRKEYLPLLPEQRGEFSVPAQTSLRHAELLSAHQDGGHLPITPEQC